MRMLALAVGHGPEVDSTYLEGLMVAEILNEFEAFSPEDALHVEDLGFDRIPRPMIRLIKQIAFTDDGRLYLKRDRSPVL
jgi:hypothetical protein